MVSPKTTFWKADIGIYVCNFKFKKNLLKAIIYRNMKIQYNSISEIDKEWKNVTCQFLIYKEHTLKNNT